MVSEQELLEERSRECARLHARLRGFAHRRAVLDSEELDVLLRAEELQIWHRFGFTNMYAYLEATLGYGPHAAAERLRVAHELSDLPELSQLLSDGKLTFSAIRELTRVATRDTEEAWIEKTRGMNLRQIETAI